LCAEIETRYQSRAAGTFLMVFIDTVLEACVPRTEFWDTGLILDMSGSKDLIIGGFMNPLISFRSLGGRFFRKSRHRNHL